MPIAAASLFSRCVVRTQTALQRPTMPKSPGNQGKHRVTKRRAVLSNLIFTVKYYQRYSCDISDRVQEAIRELESIKDAPEVSLCAVMLLMYAHKKSEVVGYIGGLSTALQNAVDKPLISLSPLSIPLLAPHYPETPVQNPNHNMGSTVAQWLALQPCSAGVLGSNPTLDTICKEFVCSARVCALDYVKELISALETSEPRNSVLHFQKLLVLCNLCGRNKSILQEIFGFCERTYRVSPEEAALATELGNQLLYLGNVAKAASWYSSAMALDGNHVEALIGPADKVRLYRSRSVKTRRECHRKKIGGPGPDRNAHRIGPPTQELCFVEAILASKTDKEEKVVVSFLNEAVEMHFAAINGLPLGVEYLEKLNPTFIVNVVKEYLVYCPKQPLGPGQSASPVLERAAAILAPVITVAPSLPEPLYFMSQVIYLSGNFDGAQGTLQRCIELNPDWSDAHLLMAQIYLSQEQYTECSHSLETGVSHNFKMREHPFYHLIKARVLKQTGKVSEATQMLRMCMSLPEMKRGAARRGKADALSVSERVSVYLELAELLRLNGEQAPPTSDVTCSMERYSAQKRGEGNNQRVSKSGALLLQKMALCHLTQTEPQPRHEATKIIQDAIHAFRGTPEEVRIVVANADMCLSKGDVEMALSMLRDVTPNQPYYIEVKKKMADIYLKVRMDKKLYVGCYRHQRVPVTSAPSDLRHSKGEFTTVQRSDGRQNAQAQDSRPRT
ncbi:unnamed protein product [Ranitomeya imitator]|uniref:Tetratricopeptide repeat protein 21A/21B second ARM domain-containing protein n=1 Tax=Ranitomeya imitator TaxID=111125 RepID=A0ABN9KU17_9NEOB|nr:unnamed protein product [Ranitomeya imitator]